MTCCSSGKARIYYNIPSKGGLKYKLKNSPKWNTILAEEQLEILCKPNSGTIITWICPSGFTSSKAFMFPSVVTELIGGQGVGQWQILSINLETGQPNEVILTGCDPRKDPPTYSFTGNVINYNFTVTGTETGNKYLEMLNLEQCPDVQTVPCKFDPAKEQHFDVLLIPDATIYLFGVPIKTPPVKECIELTKTGNQVVVEKVKTISRFGSVIDETLEERTILRDIRSPNGCPPPQVRVECCTTPDCKPKDKCPRETDCEKVCNGYKCCYYKGKLIKSIRL